jgi:hypothetical protein
MKLLHLRYNKDNNSKTYFILYLGEQSSTIIGLDEQIIPIEQVNLIRSNIEQIKKMTQEEEIKWMKENIPAYRIGFRTFNKEFVTILNEYNIKPIDDKSQPLTKT